MLPVVEATLDGYGLSGDNAVDAVRALRALLHGFVSLEVAGGFRLAADVARSYRRLVVGFDATLRNRPETHGSAHRNGSPVKTTVGGGHKHRFRRSDRHGVSASGAGKQRASLLSLLSLRGKVPHSTGHRSSWSGIRVSRAPRLARVVIEAIKVGHRRGSGRRLARSSSFFARG